MKIKRFLNDEMKGWPKRDANLILYIEIILMSLFLIMNGSDLWLQNNSSDPIYISAGYFPISQFLIPFLDNFSVNTVIIIERAAWWLHIMGILFFLN